MLETALEIGRAHGSLVVFGPRDIRKGCEGRLPSHRDAILLEEPVASAPAEADDGRPSKDFVVRLLQPSDGVGI